MRPPEPTHVRPPDLALVIPSRNAAPHLERILPEIQQTVRDLGLVAEIVLVAGGSHDNTPDVAARYGCRLLEPAEPDYGGALLAGFAATTAPYVITIDANASRLSELITQLWTRRDEADVLVASRYVKGGQADGSPAGRVLSRVVNRLCSRALALPIHDLSSADRLYHRQALAGISLRARDFDALEEILIRIYGEGWQIREIPFHNQRAGASDAQALQVGWSFLRSLVRMWRLRNSVLSADYDNRAFDSPIWLQRHWQRTRHRIVMDMLDDRDAILDVGCGSGRIILNLPNAVGLDILHRKLRWLRSRHRLLVRGSADRLPFGDASFSTVICSEVIEHIPDRPEVIGEMTRVLRPGGLLILGTPDYGRLLWRTLEWIYGKVLPDAYADEHITHFTRKSLAGRLRDAGYEILDCRYLLGSVVIFKARKPVPTAVHTNGVVHTPDGATLSAPGVVAHGT